MEIQELKGKFQVIKHLGDDDDNILKMKLWLKLPSFALHRRRISRIHHGIHSNIKEPRTNQICVFPAVSSHFKSDLVNEEYEPLKKLKEKWGEDVHNTLKITIKDMDEYNACGKYPTPELWNFKKKLKSTLKEVIKFLLNDIKSLKRQRICRCVISFLVDIGLLIDLNQHKPHIVLVYKV
ncbi:XH domain-containing protein [Arabidopsis thaliana]|uniref:XH domain-containing protein n=1 Tax=Arabidopsis thaliana TaxID=3702 RepID=Q9SI65_ARATH|nr:XH domain-containing protein [Arabidopsis thaliana]AAD26495.1 unknown protein [Arabidopsis thaliana]AEC06502.1 XH domain-containing protein [Arabidopsis thaliana]|eukprot:NP_179242.1 XH domain-containing protein [Arabidopsis thaliana]